MSNQCPVASSSGRQLQMARPGELKSHGLKQSSYRGETSDQTFHIFHNQTNKHLTLFWLSKEEERRKGELAPMGHLYVGSYAFNEWLIKDKESGQLVGAYTGESATIEIRENGCLIRLNSNIDDPSYKCRDQVLGMEIWSFDCVSLTAVTRAKQVITKMLESSPAFIVERLNRNRASFGIIGRQQVITDCPPHRFMKAVFKARDLDKTCRGLGATLAVPCTAIR